MGYWFSADQKVRGIAHHLAAEVCNAGLALLRVQNRYGRRGEERPVQHGKRADVPQVRQQNSRDAEMTEADDGFFTGLAAGIISAVPGVAV